VTPNRRGNLLFVKPMVPGARSNMTVITDRRIYLFDLESPARGQPIYTLSSNIRSGPRPAPSRRRRRRLKPKPRSSRSPPPPPSRRRRRPSSTTAGPRAAPGHCFPPKLMTTAGRCF